MSDNETRSEDSYDATSLQSKVRKLNPKKLQLQQRRKRYYI